MALIIPAAGSGVRLGEATPKPYLLIEDKTILEHTLTRFQNIDGLSKVVVSTSGEYIEATKKILERLFPFIETGVVLGGKERQHSIMNALNKISDEIDLVAIHDAVRPFIDEASIYACLEKAELTGAAIIAVSAKDTIKVSDEDQYISETPDRSKLWQAQTPQIFKLNILKKAYENARHSNYLGTDDASLVEHIGEKVALVKGNRENFKITYPLDFKLAEWLIGEQNE